MLGEKRESAKINIQFLRYCIVWHIFQRLFQVFFLCVVVWDAKWSDDVKNKTNCNFTKLDNTQVEMLREISDLKLHGKTKRSYEEKNEEVVMQAHKYHWEIFHWKMNWQYWQLKTNMGTRMLLLLFLFRILIQRHHILDRFLRQVNLISFYTALLEIWDTANWKCNVNLRS